MAAMSGKSMLRIKELESALQAKTDELELVHLSNWAEYDKVGRKISESGEGGREESEAGSDALKFGESGGGRGKAIDRWGETSW